MLCAVCFKLEISSKEHARKIPPERLPGQKSKMPTCVVASQVMGRLQVAQGDLLLHICDR